MANFSSPFSICDGVNTVFLYCSHLNFCFLALPGFAIHHKKGSCSKAKAHQQGTWRSRAKCKKEKQERRCWQKCRNSNKATQAGKGAANVNIGYIVCWSLGFVRLPATWPNSIHLAGSLSAAPNGALHYCKPGPVCPFWKQSSQWQSPAQRILWKCSARQHPRLLFSVANKGSAALARTPNGSLCNPTDGASPKLMLFCDFVAE